MDILGYLITALVVYLLGLGLFMRFAAFLHGCDDEMKGMLRKPPPLRTRFHLLRKPRTSRPKPRLRAA